MELTGLKALVGTSFFGVLSSVSELLDVVVSVLEPVVGMVSSVVICVLAVRYVVEIDVHVAITTVRSFDLQSALFALVARTEITICRVSVQKVACHCSLRSGLNPNLGSPWLTGPNGRLSFL